MLVFAPPLSRQETQMATMSPLRQSMIEDMTVRNLSPSTQKSYIYAIAKFSRHFGYAPDRLSFEQVRAYQLHLIGQKRSWSHINQAACALRFFYGVTLGRDGGIRADPRWPGARQAPARAKCRRDRALPGRGYRDAQSRRAGDGLCGWLTG
ncbi:site-specific integrase [Bradyrhizobium sp. 174]|uniref:site-specific integrase n=1 Tax=Bradyrhizobium sp. 174 TaxID=2782645 RepID=UPI0031F604F2